ncbi:ABC transporter permease [Populibacterium corticicola]
MRQNIGRLIAAGVAIFIGTTFITATLLAGEVLVKSTEKSMTASFADADLVVSASSDQNGSYVYNPIGVDLVRDVAAVNGVSDVAVGEGPYVEATSDGKSEYLPLLTYAKDKNLQSYEISDGKAPNSDSEVVLPLKVAERLKLSIGDSISLDMLSQYGEEGTAVAFTITGFSKDVSGGFASSGGAVVVSLDGAEKLSDHPVNTDGFQAQSILLNVEDNIQKDPAAFDKLRAEISKIIGERTVQTTSEAAQDRIESISGEAQILTYMVLSFAALALLVASLVISNTFQVLVAQRTKTLALLRCVGASKKQIKNSVIVEALILGFASSIAGILGGILLVQGVLWVVAAMDLSPAVPTSVTIPVAAIWLPVVAGVLTTLLASFVPARIATQVAPLAALRPIEGTSEVRRTGIVRLIFAGIFVAIGTALFVYAFSIYKSDMELALGVGVLGGALSFLGLVMSAVLWVPGVVAAVGSVFAKFGAPARLATANIGRNPRRTASTSTALFIGVTLVAMLSVGASTARTTMNQELDKQFPLDVAITLRGETDLSDSTLTAIRQVKGVDVAQSVEQIAVPIVVGDQEWVSGGTTYRFDESVNSALRDTSAVEKLTDDTVLVSTWYASEPGTEINFVDPSALESFDSNDVPQESPLWNTRVTLKSAGTTGLEGSAVTQKTFDELKSKFQLTDADVESRLVLVKVSDPSNAMDTVDALRDLLGEDNVEISGAVMERDMFQKVIDVMLLVLVGLLGVAVLIALVGVANTLSLSVIERRRESATLRAVGMSRRQLRASLAIEGMLIAGIGALVGVLLGTLYAWLGSKLLLGAFTTVVFTVRWADIAAIFAVALAAGLIASIVPGRSAARTSPVAALAVE